MQTSKISGLGRPAIIRTLIFCKEVENSISKCKRKFEPEPGFEQAPPGSNPGQVRIFLMNLNCNFSRHNYKFVFTYQFDSKLSFLLLRDVTSYL